MTTKEQKQNKQSNNVIQLPATPNTEEPGQAGKSEKAASAVRKPPTKGDDTIHMICQKTFQILNVAQPILTMLATNKKQLTPVTDVVDAIQEALRKHVEPEQGERILSTISKEITKMQAGRLTPEELKQLFNKIVEKIGSLVRELVGSR